MSIRSISFAPNSEQHLEDGPDGDVCRTVQSTSQKKEEISTFSLNFTTTYKVHIFRFRTSKQTHNNPVVNFVIGCNQSLRFAFHFRRRSASSQFETNKNKNKMSGS